MNELSGTIDLQTTLVRAEALFHRFQRTIEAVDRKNNNSSLPVPSTVRQRKTPAAPAAPAFDFNPFGRIAALSAGTNNNAAATATASGSSAQAQNQNGKGKQAATTEVEDDRPKVISEELRELLSRKVPKLEKKQNTDGFLHQQPTAAVGKDEES